MSVSVVRQAVHDAERRPGDVGLSSMRQLRRRGVCGSFTCASVEAGADAGCCHKSCASDGASNSVEDEAMSELCAADKAVLIYLLKHGADTAANVGMEVYGEHGTPRLPQHYARPGGAALWRLRNSWLVYCLLGGDFKRRWALIPEGRRMAEEIKRWTTAQACRPPIPSTWKSRKHGTRHVGDKTLGGDVVYIQGRWPKEPWRWECQEHCTLLEWQRYQATAKRIDV